MDSRGPNYAERVESERRAYKDNANVHDLPPICFYWLNRYILPQLARLGVESADQFFLRNLRSAAERAGTRRKRFISIGAGNCDTEIRLASGLLNAGIRDFVIDCLDLNEQMLDRGRQSAAAQGLGQHINPLRGDFNAWEPACDYDAVVANQALHHVVELERLFDAVERSLRPRGLLIASDMIGRNGHRRWPEALALVEEFWSELPESYRYNHQLRRQETAYPDWDCSLEGFEGIRSQDILPLMLDRFPFQFFYAFGNVTDPFTDRGFGPNFNADAEWDRSFIDRVHACDEREMLAGRLKPTHMLAVLTREPEGPLTCPDRMTPEFCVRPVR
ncbi:MAG TPA: class I SAM-dependent methyltransferase [Bryobacteraceae bacterium]|nr:class I SAM-dependent methyltransferase [Bryobacteraceae bacterium]